MMATSDSAAAVKAAVRDVDALLARLHLRDERTQRRSGGWMIRCPAHDEKTPSCLVNLDRGGQVWAHCYGCGWSADALGLVATVLGLDTRTQFREVLAATADYGGAAHLVDDIRQGISIPEPVRHAEPFLAQERPYPPPDEVNALWRASRPVCEDADVWEYFHRRALDPDPQNARVIPDNDLPEWATYRGETWAASGHRAIVRVFDHDGELRSVRAWQVDGREGAKRIPPTGYRATRVAMLDRGAWLGIKSGELKYLTIAEGEPDWLSVCQMHPMDHSGALGLVSGTWSEDWARAIPATCRVIAATHDDPAGDRYYESICDTLAKTHRLWRFKL